MYFKLCDETNSHVSLNARVPVNTCIVLFYHLFNSALSPSYAVTFIAQQFVPVHDVHVCVCSEFLLPLGLAL